jgi:hypothetical protein
MLFTVFCISFFGQSFAQVTWNTFEDKDGLFSIQIPSNWDANEVSEADALAPIDYIFRYNDKGNSFAWVELMISESLYPNASTAVDSYVSDFRQFDDFKLTKPIGCTTYTLNDEPACAFLSSQQLEGEQKRNVLNIVSISPDGIQTDAIFITSSNIHEPFFPVGEYIINSLIINSNAVNQILENQPRESIESEIPSIPKENDTSQLESEIPPLPTRNGNTIQQGTFRSVFDTFVFSEPRGFGLYDEKVSNTFSPGEDIILYIEPVGFEYGTATDGADKTLYTIEFTADFTISDTKGNVLAGQQGLSVDKIVLPYQEKNVFIPFTIAQTTPFPPGTYIITYTIHDANSGKSFDITREAVISDTQNDLTLQSSLAT